MNTNRDYLAVIDCKSGNVTLKRAVNFFKSDKNVNNIFIKLVIPIVIDDSEVLEYVDLENTENYQVILRVIKPNQEFKQYTADLLKEDSIYLIDFPTSFTDVEGSYLCEFFIETTLEGVEERTTTNSFTYTVKNSIVEQIGEEEEIEQDLLSGLIEKIAELEEQIATNDIDLSDYVTKEELDTKVDKEEGKSLISDTEIERLSNVDNYDDTEVKESIDDLYEKLDTKLDKADNYDDTEVRGLITNLQNTKVDKEEGKSLISTSEIERLSNVDNYDDTEIKELINELEESKADKSYVEEKIGDIDFSDYVTKEELDTKADIEYVDEKIANIDDTDIDLYDLKVENSISMNRVLDSKIGTYSVATGYRTIASGISSHSEGSLTVASGNVSHAEGSNSCAEGEYSHAEGDGTTASGDYGSHAEGCGTIASGNRGSHAEGEHTIASGEASHSEGYLTKASSKYQHVQGKCNIEDTNNTYAHIVGNGKSSSARSNAHTLDWNGNAWFAGTVSIGAENKELATKEYVNDISSIDTDNLIVTNSISIGRLLGTTIGEKSVAVGDNVEASGNCSHAEGTYTKASGSYSHAEGSSSYAEGGASHAEGESTTASGISSHSEGDGATASGKTSHAEGNYTKASGDKSHAEGDCTKAIGEGSHAEGWGTEANGNYSHSEGCYTKASGDYGSHAEGCYTKANGNYGSHAEGYYAEASGDYSHAEGYHTIASSKYQHVQGQYNIEDSAEKYAHIVGNGTADNNRSNAHTLDWNGNAWFAGTVTATNLPASMSFDSNGDLVVTINGVTKKFRAID